MNETKFSLEAIVSCDERGQLVLPKEIRKNLEIMPGDKLAILKCVTSDDKYCLTIIKSSSIEDLVKKYLGPMMSNVVK